MKPFHSTARVHFDELDPMGILHNARYQIHVERALSVFFESAFFGSAFHESTAADPSAVLGGDPDKFHAVRRFEIDFAQPFRGEGRLRTELWLEHLGRTSTRHGFACLGPDGELHATGARTVVKVDPGNFRPTAWSAAWREAHLTGLRLERSLSQPPL
ncbi:hotdog domain-containing protein [Kitasatospora kazusensis]|uniref:Hotdog domain-containing protein n=1 Tax=Kitasatospora kazusensis TaxID=407974 RepID=A0ABP5KNV9_9ACTN